MTQKLSDRFLEKNREDISKAWPEIGYVLTIEDVKVYAKFIKWEALCDHPFKFQEAYKELERLRKENGL